MSARTAAPTRPKLDRETVVDAALGLADAEGLDAVTIRRLAQRLGVTPMALYWHFKDKDALFAALADRVWADCLAQLDDGDAGPGAPDDGWNPLRRTLRTLVTTMHRHPAIATLVPTRVLSCDAGLEVTERTLDFLAERGFQPADAADIARFVLCSAVMLVDTQPGAEIVQAEERAEVQRGKRIALASLSASRYPHVVGAAAHLTDCGDPEQYFARGAALVVDGVRSQAPAVARRRSKAAVR